MLLVTKQAREENNPLQYINSINSFIPTFLHKIVSRMSKFMRVIIDKKQQRNY